MYEKKVKVEENRWCDRCGDKIDNKLFAAIDWDYKTSHMNEYIFELEHSLNNSGNAVLDIKYNIVDDENACVRIRDGRFSYYKQFDLCPKCKRAFKKFMKCSGDE